MPELNTQLKQETYARLSDAIEAGWQDLDQLTTGTFGSWHLGRLVAVCALGAASYAAGAGDLVSFEQPFPQAYAELTPATFDLSLEVPPGKPVGSPRPSPAWPTRSLLPTTS
jgi:hypothetical protein